MSKISQKNKELKAAGKLPKKGSKAAKTAEAQASSKAGPTKSAKPSVPNEGHCCTCKSYKRCKGRAEPCATTGKYTPRKGTRGEYKLASRYR